MAKYFFLILLVPYVVKVQNFNAGIRFENDLSWHEVMAKARETKKYVFVDCYTTWCGPCRKMEDEVYSSEKVGAYINEHFISVKVQIDKTDKDNAFVKSWYSNAGMLQSTYGVNVYPTYLFFGPDGTPVHKATGFKPEDDFIKTADDALNPEKQYYTLVKNFKPGTLDTAEMKSLALLYKKRKNIELSEKIVLDYFDRIPPSERFTSANLEFLAEFSNSIKIQEIALAYLKRLTPKEFGYKENHHFAIAFCNYDNKKVQELCINYLKNLRPVEFSDTSNLKFVIALNPLPAVGDMAVGYLRRLSQHEFGKKQNIKLAVAFNKIEEVQMLSKKYIEHLKEKDLTELWRIDFLKTFTVTTSDPGFKLFYRYAAVIDIVMNSKGYAEAKTDNIIGVQIINPIVNKANNDHMQPDWAQLSDSIKHAFDAGSADRTILAAKVRWYHFKSDWPQYLKYAIEQVKKTGIDTVGFFQQMGVNSLAWDDVFLHSDDTGQIKVAISWMEAILRNSSYRNAAYIDTYANLLYKLGNVQDALDWESKALALTPGSKIYKETYEKMLKREPTWPVEREIQKSN